MEDLLTRYLFISHIYSRRNADYVRKRIVGFNLN